MNFNEETERRVRAEREEAYDVLLNAVLDCENLEDRDDEREREEARDHLRWAKEEADAVGVDYSDIDDRIWEFM